MNVKQTYSIRIIDNSFETIEEKKKSLEFHFKFIQFISDTFNFTIRKSDFQNNIESHVKNPHISIDVYMEGICSIHDAADNLIFLNALCKRFYFHCIDESIISVG